MHALELAELAATFASYSTDMTALGCLTNRLASQKYWLECRFRHDFWSSTLATHRRDLQYLSVANRKKSWLRVIPIMEEILVSEPLARCVAYHGRLLSERQIDKDLEPLTQSVLISHIEARHRCLHLIVFGEGLSIEQSRRLNQLRRTLESYNDALLSFLHPIGPPDPFSFESLSVHRQQTTAASLGKLEIHWKWLQLTSLRMALRAAVSGRINKLSPSSQTNENIHQAVVQLFPESMFDSFGYPLSSLTARVKSTGSESAADQVILSQPAYSSIGFLFQASRPNCDSASAVNRRW